MLPAASHPLSPTVDDRPARASTSSSLSSFPLPTARSTSPSSAGHSRSASGSSSAKGKGRMNGPVAVPSEEMRPGIGEKRDTLRPTLKQRGGAVEYHIFPSSPHLLEPSVLPALSLDELQSLVISLASALADSRASLGRERKLVGVLERALEEQGGTLGDLEREELARGGEEIEEEGEWRIPVVIAGGRGKFAMDETTLDLDDLADAISAETYAATSLTSKFTSAISTSSSLDSASTPSETGAPSSAEAELSLALGGRPNGGTRPKSLSSRIFSNFVTPRSAAVPLPSSPESPKPPSISVPAPSIASTSSRRNGRSNSIDSGAASVRSMDSSSEVSESVGWKRWLIGGGPKGEGKDVEEEAEEEQPPSASPSRSRSSSTVPGYAPFTLPPISTSSPSLSTALPIPLLSHSSSHPAAFPFPERTTPTPTHFQAIGIAAGSWVSGSGDVFSKRGVVGERIRELVDALLGNLSAAALEADQSPTIPIRHLPPTISATPPVPKSGSSSFSTAKGTLGRALAYGLGASASSSLTATIRSPSPNLTLFPQLSTLSKYSPFARSTLSVPSASSASPALSPLASVVGGAGVTSTRMELGPISNEATPPTMSKERSRGTSRKGTGEEGPMVDRYGFVVDVRRGMKLLRASGGAGKLKDDDLSTSTRDGEEGEGEVPQESMKLLFNQLTEMHNKTDATASLSWDSFIRRRQVTLSSSARRAVLKSKPAKATLLGGELGAGDEGWSENLVGVAQMGLDGKKGDWLEFKGLVRKGIPIAYRPKIWAELSGSNDLIEPGLYQQILSLHLGQKNPCSTQIDMDCHRTFPTNVFFAGDGPGVGKLRNVLVAYSWRNPVIGYCQGMNNLVATLLLVYPSEEQVFWILCSLIERILPGDYYTEHLLVCRADQRVLEELVRRDLPTLAAHFEELGVELPAVTFSWFLSLFTDAVPVQTLLRIWDMLLLGGTVVLFRVALAIIQISSAELLACDSAATLYAGIKSLTGHLYQVDRLLDIAFDVMTIKEKEVELLRSRYVAELRKEMDKSAGAQA